MDFILVVDNDGLITEVMGHPPVEIAPGDLLWEMFPTSSATMVARLIRTVRDEEHADGVTVQLVSDARPFVVSLFAVSLFERVYLVGQMDSQLDTLRQEVSLVNMFANAMRKTVKDTLAHREYSIQEQFEKIQELNNELINTRRQLVKTNQQLQVINEELERRLVRDSLTGLIGPYQYWAQIEKTIRHAPGAYGLFFFFDIDDFKRINDTYGHGIGDQFLIVFAERLRALPFEDALMIRMSGDEFAMFLYPCDSIDSSIIQDIWSVFQAHVTKNPIAPGEGLSLPVSVSAGLSVFGQHTKTISEMIEFADFAMYQAKRSGKDQLNQFCWTQYQTKSNDLKRIVDQVLFSEDFHHLYQPIVRARDGQLLGHAAYLRVGSEQFDDLGDFLRAALDAGRYEAVNRLAFRVLKRATDKMGEEEETGFLFVTTGPFWQRDWTQVKTPRLIRVIEPTLFTRDELIALRAQGRQLAVQLSPELSRGNSDLSVLASEPAFIKLARGWIHRVHRDSHRQALLKGIIRFAHSQATKVIAEAVETDDEIECLIALGVDYLQGFAVGDLTPGPSMPTDDLKRRIRDLNRLEGKSMDENPGTR